MSAYENIMSEIAAIGKRKHQYNIVSTMAYLIGVGESSLQSGDPHVLLYDELKKDKCARIIHYLCKARTAIWKNYKYLETRSKAGEGVYSWSNILSDEMLTSLSRDGASFVKGNRQKPYELLIEINRLITERINNCKQLFPAWIKWDYIRNLFVIENGTTYNGNLAAAKKFYSKSSYYPYGCYINWEADDYGHILFNDLTFCIVLYGLNGEHFTDYNRCSDVKQESKDRIYDFVNENEKIWMIVDCENSDPYRLSSVLQGLDGESIRKITKIVLFDDVHTTPAWGRFGFFSKKHPTLDKGIPVEHKMTERVHSGKSVVDMEMALSAQGAFLSGEADSFIICSSDSDYFTLIRALPDAHFLLLLERAKCSEVLKSALTENDVFYCFMDDFYTGNKELERLVMNQSMQEFFASEVVVNFRSAFEKIVEKARMSLTDAEYEGYYKKLVKSLSVSVNECGVLSVEASI